MKGKTALLTGDQREIFLRHLRDETSEMHRALENTALSKKLLSPDQTLSDYTLYLSAMLAVMNFTEASVFPRLLSILPDIFKRKKTNWLTGDLQELESYHQAVPAFQPQIPSTSPSYYLGMMYVVEGSTLGGRMILKQLPEDTRNATRFFEGYGPETSEMWKSFITILASYAIEDENRQLIIEGAKDMFRFIHAYFNKIDACR